jgi:hypothetical protein
LGTEAAEASRGAARRVADKNFMIAISVGTLMGRTITITVGFWRFRLSEKFKLSRRGGYLGGIEETSLRDRDCVT